MSSTLPDSGLFAAVRFANEIEPEPLAWLWPGRIARGKLTLLIGDPGLGKSLLALDLAARLSTGRPWPDATFVPAPDPPYRAGVVLVSPEDTPADSLLPRLVAAGADPALVCIVDGATRHYRGARAFKPTCLPNPPPRDPPPPTDPCVPLLLPDHLDVLAQAIRSISVPRLVILDPLQALLAPAVQCHPAGLGRLLATLAEIAQRYSVAMLAIGHLSKSHTRHLLYRARGSLQLVAAARAVHMLSADPTIPARRVLSPLKSVYGPPPPPLAFRIDPGPRLAWEPEPCHVALELLDLPDDDHSALSDACDWLTDFLSTGPRPVPDIFRTARAAGLSIPTLRRAKRLLCVRSLKPEDASAWLWQLFPTPYNQGDQPGGTHP